MIRAQIIAEARSWVGVPYRHQGRSRAALDCAGLLVVVGQALGDKMMSTCGAATRGYTRRPDEPEMQRLLAEALRKKPRTALRPGDVILMLDHYDTRFVCHVGIVTDLHGALGLVHAYNRPGYDAVIEHTLDAEWLAKIVAVYEYREVED